MELLRQNGEEFPRKPDFIRIMANLRPAFFCLVEPSAGMGQAPVERDLAGASKVVVYGIAIGLQVSFKPLQKGGGTISRERPFW